MVRRVTTESLILYSFVILMGNNTMMRKIMRARGYLEKNPDFKKLF